MSILVPIGHGQLDSRRAPLVCLLIASVNLGAFLYTTVGSSEAAAERTKLEELFLYWQEHPYLEPPEAFARRFVPADIERAIHDAAVESRAPDGFLREDEQRALERMCAEFLHLRRQSPAEQWSLIPADGLGQRGLIGYMFFHVGWLHLLGNLILFYLVGPFVENNWGRPLFVGFYLLGGVVAGATEVWLDGGSQLPILGASGAVAACVGAFSVALIARRTLAVLVLTALWVGSEVASVKLVGATKIAFLAHGGGFAFGALAALVLKLINLERSSSGDAWREAVRKSGHGARETPVPTHRTDLTREQHQQQLEALIPLGHGGSAAEHVDAPSLEVDLGTTPASTPVGPAFDPTAVNLGSASAAPLDVSLELGDGGPSAPVVDPAAIELDDEGALAHDPLPPIVSADPEALEIDLPPPARPGTAPAPGPAVAPSAGRQAAQPAPAPVSPPGPASPTARASGPPASSTARAPGPPTAANGPAKGRRSSREVMPLGTPVVEAGRFVGRFENGLILQLEHGAKVNLSFDLISSIAFGVVDQVPGRAQRVLVLDLVLPPRQGTLRVLRFYSDAMGLDALFPAGTPPTEALRTLVFGLAERAAVRPPGDPEVASRGDYPRFGSLEEFDAAHYG